MAFYFTSKEMKNSYETKLEIGNFKELSSLKSQIREKREQEKLNDFENLRNFKYFQELEHLKEFKSLKPVFEKDNQEDDDDKFKEYIKGKSEEAYIEIDSKYYKAKITDNNKSNDNDFSNDIIKIKKKDDYKVLNDSSNININDIDSDVTLKDLSRFKLQDEVHSSIEN